MTRSTPALLLLVLLLGGSLSHARRGGIAADDCSGCHSAAQVPTVTVSAEPATFSPGAQVVVTVRIAASNVVVGGLYLRTNGAGAFSLRSGQSTKLLSEDEVVHSAPKSASSGAVTFQVNWTAPSQPGGVVFEARAVSGNNNDASSGDGSGYGELQVVYGCTGQTYYRDFDGDGVGASASGTVQDCSVPAGYSASGGDCNDSHEEIYPGAEERCNRRDDDCDGEVDEGLDTRTLFRDADADGYGSALSGTKLGCSDSEGYSDVDTDCDDGSAFVNPGMMELCNGRDDNCDGQVDETSGQVSCGIGACTRVSNSCAGCLPGPRSKELCNGVDDDCDGVVDDGASGCEEGLSCESGLCVDPGAVVPDAGSGEPAPPSSPRPALPPGGCSAAGGGLLALAALGLALWGSRRRR